LQDWQLLTFCEFVAILYKNILEVILFKRLTVFVIIAFVIGFCSTAFAQPTHTIDFEPEGAGADWTWEVYENADNPALEIVANPDAQGNNTSATVAKFTARADGNPWALFLTTDDGEFTFDETNSIVKIMVHKPVISNFTFKVEGGTGVPTEIAVQNTVTNEWEELTFDCSALIGSTYESLYSFQIMLKDLKNILFSLIIFRYPMEFLKSYPNHLSTLLSQMFPKAM
jgi:hypothetical protein